MSPAWNRALVTGASSGIGRSIAHQLATAGTDLVVVARDTERLDALAAELPVDVEVLTADLSDPDAVAAVIERLRTGDAPIDLLVNNAGLGFAKPTLETADADDERTIAVNVVALHRLTRAAGQAMLERGGGTILNVSSIAGDMPGPQSGHLQRDQGLRHQLQRGAPRTAEGSGRHRHRSVPGPHPHRVPGTRRHRRDPGAQLRLAVSGRGRSGRSCRCGRRQSGRDPGHAQQEHLAAAPIAPPRRHPSHRRRGPNLTLTTAG
jgi:NAD(P)-dependent dehydrogenase (short-subunit alcohol dehydrogenase family)